MYYTCKKGKGTATTVACNKFLIVSVLAIDSAVCPCCKYKQYNRNT